MAAFSGHRGDGDELFGCCFSVAYSHVEERWWEKRGEDESPLFKVSEGVARFLALPLPCRDVLSALVSDVIAALLKPDETKWLFSMSWGDRGDTPYPHLPSFHHPPFPLQSCPRPLGLPFAPAKLFTCRRERMHLPLLSLTSFSQCAFLTFISNSFYWHIKSWQQIDGVREGVGAVGRREKYFWSLLVNAAL